MGEIRRLGGGRSVLGRVGLRFLRNVSVVEPLWLQSSVEILAHCFRTLFRELPL
jgi:hypothetical protein